MPRLPSGRRAGLSVVTTTSALVLAVAVAAPASAAHGTVSVSLGEPLLTSIKILGP
ncbi:hypothetical protein ABZ891_25140 [Streptomyces sp. NPDC047023]|uniref:hypothetical protein n=1 Tax=Streptomyces sp. NPDC047023 TaxID=3155139 RepID=UPI00340E3225